MRMDAEIAVIKITAWGMTDVGRVRKNNEDSFAICNLTANEMDQSPPGQIHRLGPRGALFLLADGMGGEVSGEVASETCATVVPKRLREILDSLAEVPAVTFARSLREAIDFANQAILRMARQNSAYRGMGTTVTAAGLLGSSLFVGQVGDSRAYLVRNGTLVQLTRDQTFLNYLADIGAPLPTNLENDSRRNILTQAVGAVDSLDIKVTGSEVRCGDRLLLCSDGLYNMVKPREIESQLARTASLADHCQTLIAGANAKGGTDNITVILAELSGPGLLDAHAEVTVRELSDRDLTPDAWSRCSEPSPASTPGPEATVKAGYPSKTEGEGNCEKRMMGRGRSPRLTRQRRWHSLGGIMLALVPVVALVISGPMAGLSGGAPAESAAFQAVSPAPSEGSGNRTIASGTILYLRLDTPVSTTQSHLNSPVTASVVREVSDPAGVIIPLGARVTGEVAKLIPSSNPTDRAKMLMRFDRLELPGCPPLALAAHLIAVENARETVLPGGEIVGVLASEVPASLIDGAMAKIGQSRTQTGRSTANPPPKWFGQTDTTINYPAGTDLDVALDQPLAVEGFFPPAFALELPTADENAVLSLLSRAPKRASGKNGTPGDPVNLVFIGSAQEIQEAFRKAGWVEAAKMTQNSLWDAVRAVVEDQGYGAAPLSDLYLYGRPEDLAFEKMLNTMARRHHLRLWRTGAKAADGREIWLAAATHDAGIDIHPGVISHAIDPDLDSERAKVAADLGDTGLVSAEQFVTPSDPLREGLTATGGTWKTDGRLMVVLLKG